MSALHHFDNSLRRRPEAHPAQTALTPPYILEPVRNLLGDIELDPCTTPDNPVGAKRFYAPPEDGVAMSWDASTIFVNPPYGEARARWVDRCIETAADTTLNHVPRIVLLIPAHTDTRIFQRAALHADSILFVRGRLKFGVLRPNRRQVAASHPSALLAWNLTLAPLASLGFVTDAGVGVYGRRVA